MLFSAFCLAMPIGVLAQSADLDSSSTPASLPAKPAANHKHHADTSKPAQEQKVHPIAQDAMPAMDMGSMQGGSAPPGARDPDYSDGIAFTRNHAAHMHGDARLGMLLIDRLEYFNGSDGNGTSFEAQAWYGGDIDKLWLKLEGDYSDSRLDDLRSEALWDHAVSAYWDTQLGVRHDAGIGPARNWAAFGFEGLAPYWFELEATAYVGPDGRTGARLEAEYEVLFSQRLILTPKLEFNAYGKNDRARDIGSGLSDASVGLRLRYEIRRRFAPYIGVSWMRRLGTSADYARADGHPALDRQILAGVRIWF
ncbi:MAG: copper resistance protein B [Rudaea sp.]